MSKRSYTYNAQREYVITGNLFLKFLRNAALIILEESNHLGPFLVTELPCKQFSNSYWCKTSYGVQFESMPSKDKF